MSSPRSMFNLKSFLVFSVDLLSCMGQHFGMEATTFESFTLRTTGTCMTGCRNVQRALESSVLQQCYISHYDFH